MPRSSRSSTSMAKDALASVALEPQAFSRLAGSSLSSVLSEVNTAEGSVAVSVASARGQREGGNASGRGRDSIPEKKAAGKFSPPARQPESKARSKEGQQEKRLAQREGKVTPQRPAEDVPRATPASPPNPLEDSAGLSSWHGPTRSKRQHQNFEESPERKFLGHGYRPFSDHPLANSVVDQDVFNHNIMETAGVRRQTSVEAERALYLEGGSAGMPVWAETRTRQKKPHPAARASQVDVAVFNHELFEKEAQDRSDLSDCAGMQSWRSVPGLQATLASNFGASGSFDGHRAGRKHRPPSEAGSVPSCTYPEKYFYKSYMQVSPTYQSSVGAVVFGQKELPQHVCKSAEFRSQHAGAAGRTTLDIAKQCLKDSCRSLPEDAISVCSTATVDSCHSSRTGCSRSAASSPRKHRSSRSSASSVTGGR